MSAARLCRLVSRLREGNARQAAQMLSNELGRLVLDDEMPTPDRLRASNIEPRQWKREVARLLFDIEAHPDGETWNAWIGRVKSAAEVFANAFGLTAQLGLKLKRTNDGGDEVRQVHVDVGATDAMPTLTIHAAKGLEFEAVGVLVSKPHKANAPCPSTTWWADTTEEKEVAYVACSRAEKVLFIVIHAETYAALSKERPDFVGLFEHVVIGGVQAPGGVARRRKKAN